MTDQILPSLLLTAVRQKQQELDSARKTYATELQGAFTGIFKEFFEKHGTVAKAIRWRQYAPYFNDGEPCEFGVHKPELFVGEMELKERWGEGYTSSAMMESMRWVEEEHKPLLTPEMIEDFSAISELILADEETTKFIFGPDSEITATSEGVEVGEYDHD